MSQKLQKNKWIKLRHKIITKLAYLFLAPYSRIRYGIKVDAFKRDKKRPYLILFNHQTPFDQFFVGMAFSDVIYFVATEDIFSNGFVSSLIRYLVAPIPIKKQTTDVKAVMTCLRVAKEGGTIAIAPEGNRTYSGKTEYINPAIAHLAKKLRMPIALFRIEGGYGVQPRWSDVIRRGRMHAYVSRVIYPEEYEKLSDNELYSEIKEGLYVNEAELSGEFYHKKAAEYLERAFYVCPFCGLSEFESHNDTITCKKCGRRIKYMPNKELVGVDFDFPYRFANDWYEAQANFINGLSLSEYEEAPVYSECGRLFEVIPYKKKKVIFDKASVMLYGNRIEIKSEAKELVFGFNEISAVTVLGRNKLNIYHNDRIYQIKSSKRFNALKYVHFYNRYKNITKGDEDGKFLGL